jgi:hypothetical protein
VRLATQEVVSIFLYALGRGLITYNWLGYALTSFLPRGLEALRRVVVDGPSSGPHGLGALGGNVAVAVGVGEGPNS